MLTDCVAGARADDGFQDDRRRLRLARRDTRSPNASGERDLDGRRDSFAGLIGTRC